MENETLQIQRDPLPDNFETIEEFWGFWDNHSSADYEDIMEPVEVEIDLGGKYFAISREILAQIKKQAHRQGISSETLINLWLQEKIFQLA